MAEQGHGDRIRLGWDRTRAQCPSASLGLGQPRLGCNELGRMGSPQMLLVRLIEAQVSSETGSESWRSVLAG